MKYEKVLKLNEEEFKRLTGIKSKHFMKWLKSLRRHIKQKKAKCGRKNKLCIEDMILMTLEYYREYRTYFHISIDYRISESNVW